MLVQLFIALILTFLPATFKKQNTQVKPPAGSPSPEIKRTVEAITGVWKGEMTANIPGAPPGSLSWTMDCKPVALNAGALCTNGGKAPFGEMAESCLLAFDPEGKAVHYMCVTSMGEVHDHKGKWTDLKTINFEPLQAGMMGQQVTETLKWQFDNSGTIDKTSEVRLPDGKVMQFRFKGKRAG
jgi:hypothetical protein